MMNRPRNRQPRSQRGGRHESAYRPRERQTQHANNVPSTRDVVNGAEVSIVLKQDQPTGREVQGIVQDVLTSGNHPRGIKVRLTDGRVGRVQRMASAIGLMDANRAPQMRHDVRHGNDELPPARTLADFLPDDTSSVPASAGDISGAAANVAQCPICNDFTGDEYAVSRHVEKHLEAD